MSKELESLEGIVEELREFLLTSEVRPDGGQQLVFRFPNGYGGSVVEASYSYGLELAVASFEGPEATDWRLCYTTPITGDVFGWLTPSDLFRALLAIKALPPENSLSGQVVVITAAEQKGGGGS